MPKQQAMSYDHTVRTAANTAVLQQNQLMIANTNVTKMSLTT
jgi:hypothetical protein